MVPQLRSERRKAGLSIQRLIVTSGVSRPTIENAEKGTPISYEKAAKIVNALNSLTKASHTVESLNIVTID